MTIREERARQRALKRKRQRLTVFLVILALLVVAALVSLGVVLNKITPDEIGTTAYASETEANDAEHLYQSYLASSAMLKAYLDEDDGLESAVRADLGDAYNASITVFISVSDGNSPAVVASGSGVTLDLAWQAADEAAGQLVRDRRCETAYIRADIVNGIRRIQTDSLASEISGEAGLYGEFFRKGVAFDPTFSVAFLESEINANELIDYDINKTLLLDKVNLYLAQNGAQTLSALPDSVYLFTTRGYIKDGEGCSALEYADNASYGRRTVERVDRAYAQTLAASVAAYLADGMTAEGKFTYGIYPIIGLPIDNYSAAYHAAALSALARYSLQLDSAGLYAGQVSLAADYLTRQIVFRDASTGFAADAQNGEITAGACAQAISAFCDYAQLSGEDAYLQTAEKIGAGLISMISGDGALNHVLYYGAAGHADFSVKTAQSDRTYDSSAVYALAKLYGATNNEACLNAARTMAAVLVKGVYSQYADAWVSEAMDELTKYDKNVEYFHLALRNYTENADALASRVISDPQYTRLLVASYHVYKRMQTEGVVTEPYSAFDYNRLIKTCVARADDLLNGYAYPEVVMYFKNPNACVGAFYVRQDGFRIRIDDMASFIFAYLAYAEDYIAINADVFEAEEREAASRLAGVTATTAAQSSAG